MTIHLPSETVAKPATPSAYAQALQAIADGSGSELVVRTANRKSAKTTPGPDFDAALQNFNEIGEGAPARRDFGRVAQ